MGGVAPTKILTVMRIMTDSITQGSERRAAENPSAIKHPLVARGLRDFGDGFVAVLLPVYLIALGLSPFQVGIVATTALLGSALMTLGAGMLGSRYDHRRSCWQRLC